MRASAHVKGILLLAAAIGSIGIIPGLTRDVRGDVELPFTDSVFAETDKDLLVVFAGFPGCNDICPTTLMGLDRVYREVGDDQLGVAFVNVLLHTPSHVSANYAAAFNPNFVGYSVVPEQKDSLYSQMGLKAGDSIENVANHKANLFLYQRKQDRWMLTSVYQRKPQHEQLVAHLRRLLEDAGRS